MEKAWYIEVDVKSRPMKPEAPSLNLDLREVFGIAILQSLNKPHRKANLDTGTQLNENHASTISSGNRDGTVFDNVSALCTSTLQTRLANCTVL